MMSSIGWISQQCAADPEFRSRIVACTKILYKKISSTANFCSETHGESAISSLRPVIQKINLLLGSRYLCDIASCTTLHFESHSPRLLRAPTLTIPGNLSSFYVITIVRREGITNMPRFVVQHRHQPENCPARDEQMGPMLIDHLSPANASKYGIIIQAEAVIDGAHTLYMILEAPDQTNVRQFMEPFARAGTVEVLPASTCEAVVERKVC